MFVVPTCVLAEPCSKVLENRIFMFWFCALKRGSRTSGTL